MYQAEVFLVVFVLQLFLYLIWYASMSTLGHFNNFFFAAHLLDIAMVFKSLRVILSSVTHNGKQASGSTSRGRSRTDKKLPLQPEAVWQKNLFV